LRKKKSAPSPFGAFLWHPYLDDFRAALWSNVEHYRHQIPPSVSELLGHVTASIARPRPRDVQHLKEILERHMMILTIELTNICNANCRFCAYRHQKRAKGIISNELFKQAIHQYAEAGGGILSLTPTVGDPLVDRSLVERIKFAKQIKQISYILLYTNLIGLEDFDLKDLLRSGLGAINVSTCVGSREMYANMFGVDRYDSVMRNLETLLQENRKLGDRPKVTVHVRADRPYDQTESSPTYRRIVKRYGREACHIECQYDNWTGFINEGDLPRNHRFAHVQDISEPCSELYNGVIVFLNGDVGICSRRDLEAKLVIGNIHKSSLQDIWRGEELNTMRNHWRKGDIPAMCRRCRCYVPLSRLITYSRTGISRMERKR
jgi:radical SAM protein with 4Fe4S-binding SPASM domain